MKTYFSVILSLLLTFIIVSCNLPTANVTPNPDQNAVATEVGKILTSIPVETVIPSPVITEIQPTATSLPSEAPTITSSPTETSEPTKTSEPTQTVAPTNTSAPILTPTTTTADPRTTLGSPTRSDKMDTTDYWYPYEDEHVKIQISGGSMQMTGINADAWHGWTLSSPSLQDFYLEETVTPGACEGSDSYGLLSRAPDGNSGYFYGFSCDGKYIFKKWDGSKFTVLMNWTANAAILKGADQANRLGLMAKGNVFSFYANGVKIGDATDDTFEKGAFGLWVAAYRTPGFTVHVDEVDYWDLS